MRERFDLVVAGCGPAGASCAGRAAELGLSVLALERASFPRSKPCAAGLTEAALELLGDDAGVVAHDTAHRLRIELGGTVLVWESDAPLVTTTTRRELDSLLARRAAEAGARIEFGTALRDVKSESGRVVVKAGGRTVECGYLVGADGPLSVVARRTGAGAQALCGAAYVRAFPRSPAELEIHHGTLVFDPTATRRGYAWVFPKRDHLNVGIYSQIPIGRWLLDDLSRFVDSRFAGWESRGPYAAPIPGSARRRQPGDSRVLLVGDAAGFADPITGEGISCAMTSGRAAAEAVAAALESGAGASTAYGAAVRSHIRPQLTRLKAVGNLMYSLGPGGMRRAAAFPLARFVVRRLGWWETPSGAAGRLSVDTSQSGRHQQ